MRYFLVSLILNLALLFLPLNSRPIESEKPQETINIKLNFTQDEPKKTMEYIPPQSAEPFERPIEMPQETPPEPVKFEPEEPVPEILEQPEPKPEPIKPKEQKKQPPKPKIKKTVSPKPVQAVKEEPKFEPVAAPAQILPVVQPSSNSAPTKETNSGKIKDESVCKEGVGFTVEREPETKYPKKALMLRLDGTFKVEVDFKFDGEIKIIAVRGENKIFNDEAVKITKELEIKALRNIEHCIITKPYEFKTEK